MSAASSSIETNFYITSGTVERDAPCYVVRQADEELYEGLRQGKFCYVLTPRQMGKSSLMVRTAARLREAGVGAAVLDLTAIGQNLSAEQWYGGLISQLGRRLDLEDELLGFWGAHAKLGPLQRWTEALRQVVLPRYPGHLVIFIDEIDAVRSLPFSTDEFFAAIRELYNHRTEDAELKRLTFCLLGVATPSDLIRDTRTTPFNIGQHIELHDFTEAEAAPLAQGLNCEAIVAAALLKRIHYWTGGHPYLTQRLCQAIAETDHRLPASDNRQVDGSCEELFLTRRAREQDDNLLFVRERMLRGETDLPALLTLYSLVWRGKRVQDDETNPLASVLRLSGIARTENGCLHVRNHIYERVFDKSWIETSMPDAELRRQRTAYRRGLLRATAVATLMVVAMAAMLVFAIRQRNTADRSRAEAFSRELAATAITQLPLDPELSLLLSIEALHVMPTAQAEDALRQSLIESHVRAVLRGHQPNVPVNAALFSPNGRFLLTTSWDRTARLWETSTWRGLSELRGHNDWLSYSAFSPDSKLAVTISFDGTGRLWETATGRLLTELRGHTDVLRSVTFSPDGKLFVTTSQDATARVWEAASGKELHVLRGHTADVHQSAFSPDGRFLVTVSSDRTVFVWHVNEWRIAARLKAHTGPIIKVAFSPDGKRLITAGDDGTARLWLADRWRLQTELRGHTNPIRSVAFSPDSKYVATASDDGTARLWESSTGRVLKELREHTSKVYAVAFSPDGRLIVTAGWDGAARLWTVSTGQSVAVLRGHQSALGWVAFSPDGRLVVTTSDDGTARVWSSSNGGTELLGHTEGLFSASFSPDGRFVVTASHDRTAHIWEASSGRIAQTLLGHTGPVTNAVFSPDGRLIATASYDQTARLWESATGRSLRELHGHAKRVWDVAFSPDGRSVVTACEDGIARVWETNTGRSLVELRGHGGRINSATFSPDGHLLLTASHDQTARIWDAQSGKELLRFQGHAKEVSSAAFSPDGKLVATGSYDSTVRLWDAGTGRSLRELHEHRFTVTRVAFSFDGRFLVTASWDGTPRVWDIQTGQSIAKIRGHSDEVWGAAFSPDGKYIVTASYDKTARIYACEVCRPINNLLALARNRVTRELTPKERVKYLHEPLRQ